MNRGNNPSDADPRASHSSSGARPWGRVLAAMVVRPEAGGCLAAISVFVFFAIFAGGSGFVSPLGVSDWVNTASQLGIIAIPVGIVMIAGELDLSVGSVAGAASILVAVVSGYYGLSAWVAVLVALAVAAIIGAANGLITVYTRLPSLIVTLAMMMIVAGGSLALSLGLTGSNSISVDASGIAKAFFAFNIADFNVSNFYFVAVFAVAVYVMRFSPFGNWVYATGGDLSAAQLAGVPTNRVKLVLFICSALSAALVGVIQTFSFGNGSVSLGSSYIFSAIAASVIGGVLLTGGYGSPVGIAFGAITYGIVSMGVFFLGWNSDLTELFIGLLLLLGVMTNNQMRRLVMAK